MHHAHARHQRQRESVLPSPSEGVAEGVAKGVAEGKAGPTNYHPFGPGYRATCTSKLPSRGVATWAPGDTACIWKKKPPEEKRNFSTRRGLALFSHQRHGRVPSRLFLRRWLLPAPAPVLRRNCVSKTSRWKTTRGITGHERPAGDPGTRALRTSSYFVGKRHPWKQHSPQTADWSHVHTV